MKEIGAYSLTKSNARDTLIARRNEIRQKFLEKKERVKTSDAKEELPKILEKFSTQYFGSNEVWAKLTVDEKKELAKICEKFCKKWLIISGLPIIVSLLGIIGLGIFLNPVSFLLLFLWVVGGVVQICTQLDYHKKYDHLDIDDQINYLLSKNRILKSNLQIGTILSEKPENIKTPA